MAVILLAGFALGIVASRSWFGPPYTSPAQDGIAKRVPEFSLPDLTGRERSISEWSGKTLVINFWATWCPPCRKEIPLFVRLQEELSPEGVQFIGIAVDQPEAVRRFRDEFGIHYPLLITDLSALQGHAAMGQPQGGLPYTLFVDRTGMIRTSHLGELTEPELRAAVEGLLKQDHADGLGMDKESGDPMAPSDG